MFMMSFGAPWMIRSYDVGGQRLCASNDKSDLFCMVIEHKTNTFKLVHLPLYGRHKMYLYTGRQSEQITVQGGS